MDDPRRFVDPNIDIPHVTRSDDKMPIVKIEPIGDMVEKGLSDILVDSCSLDCTDRPSCPCPKCQARLRKMLKDSAKRIESGRSPLNRAQRRALERRRGKLR